VTPRATPTLFGGGPPTTVANGARPTRPAFAASHGPGPGTSPGGPPRRRAPTPDAGPDAPRHV